MYGSGGGGTGGAAAGAGAAGITQLPDTAGIGGYALALLTPDSPLGVLFLVLAAWALIGTGLAIWRIAPRSEA